MGSEYSHVIVEGGTYFDNTASRSGGVGFSNDGGVLFVHGGNYFENEAEDGAVFGLQGDSNLEVRKRAESS